MNKEELLFNDIYERTKDFGRTQFVREIMRLQRENKKLKQKLNQLETNRDELKKWLKEEKDRLVRECSNIYEDSLGKTKLVSEDIFNELTKVSEKIDELERGKE